jgi:hypothetical protein
MASGFRLKVCRGLRSAWILRGAAEEDSFQAVSTHEILLEEIKHQPEPVLREVLHYLKFLARQREEEQWADVLPTREVEQEVLDMLDAE